jgi:hypothetical protein
MDFSDIRLSRVKPPTRERYIREVQKLQQLLGLSTEKFALEYFKDVANITNIAEVLEAQDIGQSRKSE